MDKRTVLGRLRDQATVFGKRALEELLTDEQRLEALDFAKGSVAEGRRLLDEQFERLFGALGLATQADLERVVRKVVRLRKRLETLQAQVEAAVAKLPSQKD